MATRRAPGPHELTRLRRDFGEWLPERARVYRRVVVQEGREGESEEWVPDGAAIGARLSTQGLSATEQTVAAKIVAVTVYVVTVPHDTAISERDRIGFETINGVELDPVRMFDVAFAGDRSHEMTQRVLATELRA